MVFRNVDSSEGALGKVDYWYVPKQESQTDRQTDRKKREKSVYLSMVSKEQRAT